MSRPKSDNPRNSIVNVRLTSDERKEMEKFAKKLGLKSLSAYIRYLHDKFKA